MRSSGISRRTRMAAALALACGVIAAVIGRSIASDHQDTPELELNPRMDINDVYAFPGASPDRIVLAMTTSSPITPGNTPAAFFDPNLLYQIKIDNDGDYVEDLVFQITFEGDGADQLVHVRGPVVPNDTGTANTVVTQGPEVSGPFNQVLGSPGDVQVFAGPRDDPFWIDLEWFFRIIPDRKPVTGVLSNLPDEQSATAFRPPGEAMDFLRGFNALAIVIELPVVQLTEGGSGRLGVWGTISR
jgi:Domain of unknown function (DUF4331)